MKFKEFVKKVTPPRILQLYRRLKPNPQKRAYKKHECEKYIKEAYKNITGYDLDLENPKTLTEKQQWLKLYGVTSLKTECTDKYLVRNYIEKKIGKDYLIPILSFHSKDHFFNAKEISYDELPQQFCIQCNHGSGMTFVVKDKDKLGKKGYKKLQKKLNDDLKVNYAFRSGMELVYKNIKPCIFVTKYLTINDDLPDYKFMCFNKSPKFVWVDTNRFVHHRRTVYNLDFTKADFNMANYDDIDAFPKPANYDKMLELAKILCQDFSDYVRVDFYDVNGKIYFGELTFSSGSGYELPRPIEYNRILGDMLVLGEKLPIV